jgi:Zn-dependent protease
MRMSPFLNPTFLISILIALSVHESAHGYVALKLGDPTAKYAGRVTLNPLAHLDLLGTLMFLIIGFGWAKPVPVDPRYFKNPKRDCALTAAAGPASNLILAFFAFIGLFLVSPQSSYHSLMFLLGVGTQGPILQTFLFQLFASSVFINLALMAFNLLPIAPLDGSKVLHLFVPYRHEEDYLRFMQYGPYILLFLLVFESFLPIPIISGWVFGIANTVLEIMNGVVAALASAFA